MGGADIGVLDGGRLAVAWLMANAAILLSPLLNTFSPLTSSTPGPVFAVTPERLPR